MVEPRGRDLMSANRELHVLVDLLDEAAARDAQRYVRDVLGEDEPEAGATNEALGSRMSPSRVPGHEFGSRPPRTLREAAAEQGVEPVARFEDLLGDFWPADESADDFVAAVREWRRERGRA
jgi:hypothetical protein